MQVMTGRSLLVAILAVNVIAAIAVANGVLVLAGTLAAGRRQRETDAVVQKVLGATRGDVLVSFLIEHVLLGLFAALIGSAVGVAAAWAITRGALEVPFSVDPLLIGGVTASAIAITLAVGTLTTWRALSSSPARHLREA